MNTHCSFSFPHLAAAADEQCFHKLVLTASLVGRYL
jgi:hypothetical protein